MKSRPTIKTAILLTTVALVALMAIAVLISSSTTIKWVGHKDLDVRFLITDLDTGLPINGATIHVRPEEGGFYENWDKGPFNLVTDNEGVAHYVCKNNMCGGSQGLFEDTFVIYIPSWWLHASAPGYLDSEPLFLDVLERQRQVDRGDEQATLVVKIALRKAPAKKE